MKKRKQLLADLRKSKAIDQKEANRDRFVRRWLRKHGIKILIDSPEKECFRGRMCYVSAFAKVGGCPVGIVEGCANCYRASDAFEIINTTKPPAKLGKLPFSCRQLPSGHLKVWIVQPWETKPVPIPGNTGVAIKWEPKPGYFNVRHKRPPTDAHGHIIPQAGHIAMPLQNPPGLEFGGIPEPIAPVTMPPVNLQFGQMPPNMHPPTIADIPWLQNQLNLMEDQVTANLLRTAWNAGRLIIDDAHTTIGVTGNDPL
jgi:hypothetical protein